MYLCGHTDHRIVQTYSGEGISGCGFVEPTVRLPDGLLRDTQPVTRCRNAGTSSEECLILLLSGEHFGCLVKIIHLLVKIRTRIFRIWNRCTGSVVVSAICNDAPVIPPKRSDWWRRRSRNPETKTYWRRIGHCIILSKSIRLSPGKNSVGNGFTKATERASTSAFSPLKPSIGRFRVNQSHDLSN